MSYVEEKEISMETLDLHSVAVLQTLPIQVKVIINNKKVCLEVDTGASCSVKSLTKIKELGQLQDLKESLVKLKIYTDELVKPYRTTEVKISYKGKENYLPLLV